MTGPELIAARAAASQRYHDAVEELLASMTTLAALDRVMQNRHVAVAADKRPSGTFQVSPAELRTALSHPDAMPADHFPAANYQELAQRSAETIQAAHERSRA